MPLDLAELKKHPYAVGGVVIVGGIVVFYLLSQGSSSTASSTGSDYSAALAADSANNQASAAAAIQTNAQQVALQTAQLNASVANTQTSASESVANTQTLASLAAALNSNSTSIAVTQSNNDAATLQQANTLNSQQNIYSIQEAGLQDQINQAAEENANNNATSLAGLVDQLNYGTGIATLQTNAGVTLGEQAETDQNNINQQVLNYTSSTALANAPNAANLNSVTGILQTLLSGNNPSVAAAGTAGSTSSANTQVAGNTSIINSVISQIGKVGTSVSTGLFA